MPEGTLRILEAIRLLGLEKKTRISLGLLGCLFLGNLDARRDWGLGKSDEGWQPDQVNVGHMRC